MAETGAIVTYLTDRAGGALVPAPGTPERARYTYWLHYAEGSAMPPLLLKLVFARLAPGSPGPCDPWFAGSPTRCCRASSIRTCAGTRPSGKASSPTGRISAGPTSPRPTS